jgi:ElaB/YqjD/DUF883 family membrane-anchored ribosome-binding protein
MDRESPELIKQGMQDTRQSLTDKVAALEQQVFGTIHEATSAVHETVHSVKNAMNDTISSVKSTFDINSHVREHPWAAVAGAVAAGIAAGYFVGSGRKAGETGATSDRTWASADRPSYGSTASSSSSVTSRFGGMFDDLIRMGQEEFRKITESALTTLAAAVKQNLGTGIQHLVENGLSFSGYRHEPEGSDEQNGHHNGRNRHEARF